MDEQGLIRTLVGVAEAPVDPPVDFQASMWETLLRELAADARSPGGFGEDASGDDSRPGLVPQILHQRSRRPRGVWAAVATFTLVVAVGLAVWAIRPQEPAGEITDSPPSTVSADDDTDTVTEGVWESGVWSRARTRLGRDELMPRVFVIDDRVLVIHEQNQGMTVVGEIYDPVANEAREIADSGLVWRAHAVMVWTGTELLMVGGSNGPGIDQIGAAYDPASDTWRLLPDPPGNVGAWDNSLTGAAVWTGTEMLIPARGLAFDPVTDRWRTFTPQPGPQRNAPVTVWTGTEVVVWGGCDAAIPQCDDFEEGLLTDGYAYTPATDAWRPLAPSPLATGVHPAGEWTGTGLLIFAGTGDPDDGVTFARYDPFRDRWQELAEPPLAPRRYAASTWTGRSFVLWGGSADPEREFSDGAVYDVVSDVWELLPPAPNSAARDRHAMTWVAGRLYITGGHRTLGPLVFTPGEPLESSTRSTTPEASVQTVDIEPLVLGDGDSLVEVVMEDGTRFAVLLPTSLVPGQVAVTTGMSQAEIEGPGFEGSLSYAYCPGATQDAGSLNSRGALVARVSDRLVVCRPDQLLVLEITTTADVPADSLDAFDVVPVDVGDGYLSAVVASSVSAFCCEAFGPIRLGSLVITANRHTSGRITAWDYSTLSPQWTVDIGDSSILLGSYDDLIMATPGGGRLVGIDTGAGETRWEFPLALGEEVIGAAGEPGESTWYVSTQFPNTGEVASPRLRAVDVQSGELAWMAQMRPETVLQWVDPALFNDKIVVMDVPRIGADQGTSTTSHLIAYDRATGDQLWATDLGDPTEGFSDRLLAHDSERNLLFAATPEGEVFSIDPETGQILWRAQTGFVRIIGQDEEAVRLQRGSEQLELDLQTGEVIER